MEEAACRPCRAGTDIFMHELRRGCGGLDGLDPLFRRNILWWNQFRRHKLWRWHDRRQRVE
jgi:hypothetical protein